MFYRSEGDFLSLDTPQFDLEETADIDRGRKHKPHKKIAIDLRGIHANSTAADVDAMLNAKLDSGLGIRQRHKATAVDLTEVVKSMAGRKARKETEDHINDASGFFKFFKKSFRRQTASGKERQLRDEPEKKILDRGT